MVPLRYRIPWIVLSLAILVWGAGCSHSSRPGGAVPDGTGEFAGVFDPGEESFTLTLVDSQPPGGVPVPVALIGSNLRFAGNILLVDVAVENRGNLPLYAPGEVVIHDLAPRTVMPTNADWVQCPPIDGPLPNNTGCLFGFDYSGLLGNDGILQPNEISAPRTWRFQVLEPGGFSFGATVRFALEPSRARIAGQVFWDANENGQLDPNEDPFGGGAVFLSGPGKAPEIRLNVPMDGRYSFPVELPGFYTLRAEPPPTFAPVYATTPNPLEIVLPASPGGGPESYLDAHFGFANLPLAPPLLFWAGPGQPSPQAPYDLVSISLAGTRLRLRVGFSGCGPDHDFALYMVGPFMESNPVQAKLVLAHDDFGELCDAYFTRDLDFDLITLVDRYRETYGDPVNVLLRFTAYNGQIHSLQLSLFGGEAGD